ncbi:TorF family putative porin [Methylophaga sulfidovorans]|jgi:uncharacterized protein (TIGR02001 family)|uniref:TIGR02001 family outer membrane protein n=1 Tax=Methylophaga sulfidovorans TaxID=45496 RepID=A0A1I3W703_9GAMM|nr:TorF family putative porin [Methylophaga sulfidovorans]SFK03212.1 conserved hypothetical protein [Methylophaga sulfidovorans]
MKLRTISALTLAASSMFAASSAMAWESEDGQHSVSASVGLFSDYIFRGISLTDEDPAIQGSFDYSHSSGLYAGTWASNISTGADNSIEIDLYAGFANEFGDSGVGYDVSVLRYTYPGTSGSDGDYTEFLGSLSYSYFTAMIGYTSDIPDGSGHDVDEVYYNLAFDYELPYGIGFNAAVGYTDSERNDFSNKTPGTNLADSYVDYTIGLSKPFVGLDWSIAYVGTNSDGKDFEAGEGTSDDRFVASVSTSF